MEKDYSILNANSFDEVVESRTYSYNGIKAGNFRLFFLSVMYKQPSHFIYELLQNAEDNGATEVGFELYADKLVFSHNGPKLFDLQDLKGITGYADSPKEGNDEVVGKFGLGFKAVYAVCKTPQIYSGEMCFSINDYIVPKKIDKMQKYANGTYFVLPFESDNSSAENIFEMVNRAISSLVSDKIDDILFLKQIKKIKWSIKEKSGYILRSVTQKEGNTSFVYSLRSYTNNNELIKEEEYLVFKILDPIKKKKFISLAYKYNSVKNKIEVSNSTRISVLFPTEKDSFLPFKIDGPFETTQTRESIYEEDNINNKLVLETALDLYYCSLTSLQKYGLYDIDFLKILPFKKINQPNYFYDAFNRVTVDFFEKAKAIISKDGEFVSKDDCVLARSTELTDLLDKSDLKKIFGKQYWVISGITQNVNSELFNFFTGILGIKPIDLKYLLSSLEEDSLVGKGVEWFEKFYGFCSEKTTKNYMYTPLILTESGEIKSVLKSKTVYNTDGIPNVFLPKSTFDNPSKIVNKALYNTKNGKEFFELMGIKEQNTIDCIRDDFLPDLLETQSEGDYLDLFDFFVEEYSKLSADKKKEFVNLFTSEKCILSFNQKENKFVMIKAMDCLVGDAINKTLYGNIDDVFFLSDSLQSRFDTNEACREFISALGINKRFIFKKISYHLSYEAKKKLIGNQKVTYSSDFAWDILYFDAILQNINEETSKMIWKSLTEEYAHYFYGEYTWSYSYSGDTVLFPSYFVQKLNDCKWLFVGNDTYMPTDLTYREVSEIYGENNILKKHLGFKTDMISKLPQEIQDIYSLTKKGVPMEVLMQAGQAYLEQTNAKTITLPDPTEGETIITVEAFTKKKKTEEDQPADEDSVTTDIYSDVLGDDNPITELLNQEDRQVVTTTKTSVISDKKQKLGEWGEKKVVSALLDKYKNEGYNIIKQSENSFVVNKDEIIISVERKNDKSNNQKGYDILVKENDIETRYIEVKTKGGSALEAFPVHGAQWEFAKKLSLSGKGSMYNIYVVYFSEEKTEIRVVEDPYQKWIEGKLSVDPVNIII